MKRILAIGAVSAMPFLALAQSINYQSSSGLSGLISWAGSMLAKIVPLFVALAVVYFIWEVFQYTIAGDEDKKKAAKTQIIWGIVGIFIMVSVWGLVAILQSTFNTSSVGISNANIQQLVPTNY